MKKNWRGIFFGIIIMAFCGVFSFSANAATAPGTVQNLRSTSHAVNAYSNDPTIDMSWSAPTGVTTTVYYYYVFNTSSSYTIDEDVVWDEDLSASTSTTALSADLSSQNGTYYFHIVAAIEDGVDELFGATSTKGPYYIDTKAPTNVNVSAPTTTNSQVVTLTLYANGATQMYISNSGYGQSGSWESYATSKQWELTDGYGSKTVYVQFRDAALNSTESTTPNTRVTITFAQNIAPQIKDLRASAQGYNYSMPNVYFSLYDYEGNDLSLSLSSSNYAVTTPEGITITGMTISKTGVATYTMTTIAAQDIPLTLTIKALASALLDSSSTITLTVRESSYYTNSDTETLTFSRKDLLVEFSNISVIKETNQMLIQWQTTSEVDTAGFHIQRSETIDGPFSIITDRIIPTQGSAISGASYSYQDSQIESGKLYYYQLVEVDLKGNKTPHPIKNTATREGESDETLIYDANNDGKEDIADVIYLLQILTNFQKSE
ncbi:MAG: hypothetical protein HQK75_12125 [Candidatus Magnetomorum sp.]|nr:hypothetical protein [Candidatus Magnetomorum sp.]